ncbi:MAG: hypothetical protein IKD44_12130 [Lentisphaeria bacterium]|nr:hypothetical protein [Lentisphaeria bacterium]
MRWKDFLTTEYKKLDITLEKASDVQFLSLLHDAYFDPAEIRYARKRLVIPIKDRTTWEWTPGNDRMPGGEVDGELVLYPVADPWDWQVTISGEQFTDENQLHNIEINEISLKKKKISDGKFFYHFQIAFPSFDLPCSLDVVLKGGDAFPLIHYRDKTLPQVWSEPMKIQ